MSDGWDLILTRLVTDAAVRRAMRSQLSMYRSKDGNFGSVDAQVDKKNVEGPLWWENYGADTLELQRLAIRILSQNASSFPIEQLWSVFTYVASKKRNPLLTTRSNDLVFVAANLRLLGQVASGSFENEQFIRLDHESDLDDLPPSPMHDLSLNNDIDDNVASI